MKKSIFGQVGLYLGTIITLSITIPKGLDFREFTRTTRNVSCEDICFVQDILERSIGLGFMIILPLTLLGVLIDWLLEKKHKDELVAQGLPTIRDYVMKGTKYGLFASMPFVIIFLIRAFTSGNLAGLYLPIFAFISIPLGILIGGLLGAIYKRHVIKAIIAVAIIIAITFLSVN